MKTPKNIIWRFDLFPFLLIFQYWSSGAHIPIVYGWVFDSLSLLSIFSIFCIIDCQSGPLSSKVCRLCYFSNGIACIFYSYLPLWTTLDGIHVLYIDLHRVDPITMLFLSVSLSEETHCLCADTNPEHCLWIIFFYLFFLVSDRFAPQIYWNSRIGWFLSFLFPTKACVKLIFETLLTVDSFPSSWAPSSFLYY